MRLKKVTLKDETLTHQVVFYLPKGSIQINISCNCLELPHGGHESMGTTGHIEQSRELYNNPANHKKPFGKDDIARW